MTQRENKGLFAIVLCKLTAYRNGYNGTVLKTVVAYSPVGSNPTATATLLNWDFKDKIKESGFRSTLLFICRISSIGRASDL